MTMTTTITKVEWRTGRLPACNRPALALIRVIRGENSGTRPFAARPRVGLAFKRTAGMWTARIEVGYYAQRGDETMNRHVELDHDVLVAVEFTHGLRFGRKDVL